MKSGIDNLICKTEVETHRCREQMYSQLPKGERGRMG